jgi:serine/threonine-protein kinase
VDGRSDQFSLAVIAYEMLTGEKPYTGEHLTTVVYKIVAEEPVPPRRLNPSLSAGIENVLRKALSKKPDARYRNCGEFSEALEKACTGTKGWKPLPRGGLLNAATMADVRAPQVGAAPAVAAALPPPHRKSRADASATTTREVKKKSGFPAFLLAILVATGLLIVIGSQLGPWHLPGSQPADGGTGAVKKDAPAPTAPAVTPPTTPPVVAPEDAKPSPVSPAAGQAQAPAPVNPEPAGQGVPPAKQEEPLPPAKAEPETVKPSAPPAEIPRVERRPPAVRAGAPQEVEFTSSPGGATATLDGNSSMACTTPCSQTAAQGKHTVVLTMPGYEIVRRDFTVNAAPLELTPFVLTPTGGTLMLSSIPDGAAISVNGKRLDKVTPAAIPLGLGTYSIMIEKGGKQATEQVEIKHGITVRRMTLGQ